MAHLIENYLNKMLNRDTSFFLKGYKRFNDDVDPSKIPHLADISLECLGYGIFDKPGVLANFFKYLMDVLDRCKEIRTLKITLNGFNIGSENKLFIRIAEKIVTIKERLKSL